MNSDLMTAGEVSKLLADVTPATVRSWGDKGLLPVQRTHSGMRLFNRSDVERLSRERSRARTEAMRHLRHAADDRGRR